LKKYPKITQDFEMANIPASYFIHVGIGDNDVPDTSFENVKTQEKLVIKKKRDYKWKLLISRYPLEAAKSWIETDKKEITEWGTRTNICTRKRCIIFDEEVRIAM
jgi:hypothetical protein